MENYSYTTSYPESGDSSPRSREIEFENPPPWEEQNPSTYKVKFMCSYGGKIQPRPHDNQLSYMGGETKILAVDHNIKFSSLAAKLSAICDTDACFKYQLPGEDLDALISVTNDDDLEHMMHEYDRLYRASPKPARLRLFLFPANSQSLPATATQSLDSSEGKLEREQFVDALNSAPIQQPPPLPPLIPPSNAEVLFGIEKGMPPPPVPSKLLDPITDSVVPETQILVPAVDEQVIGTDPIHKHIQDMQRLRIAEEQAVYRRKSDENLAAAFSGDYYVQKMPEKASPTALQGTVPVTLPIPAGYWPENQIPTGVYPPTTVGADQQVYMIQAPAGVYHAPMSRMAGPNGQGYYTMQRMQPEIYREQPVYNVVLPPQSAAAQPTLQPQQLPKPAGYSDGGFGMVRPTTTGGGIVVTESGYAQVAYDGAGGRQVYYTPQGGVVAAQASAVPSQAQFQAMAAAAYSADMRPAVNFNQEAGKVAPAKVPQDAM
ncbi:hypothetical protein LguiA_027275 [Lonicera macranthoides]